MLPLEHGCPTFLTGGPSIQILNLSQAAFAISQPIKQNITNFSGGGCSGPKPEVELVLQEGGICRGRGEVYSSEKISVKFPMVGEIFGVK